MPLAHWRTHRDRARQKQKVLHMLALSGVVRPSHIEFRYTVPLLQVGTSNTTVTARAATAIRQSPAQIEEPTSVIVARGRQLFQWLYQGLTAPL
jgi:hypothetical protein